MTHDIELNAVELQAASLLADRLTVTYALKYGGNPRDYGVSSFLSNYESVVGEMAVARFLGVQPKVAFTPNGDGGIDFIHRGVTIDAKCRGFQTIGDDLIIRNADYFKADVVIHSRMIDPVTVRLLGWISRKRFLATAREKEFKKGKGIHLYVPAS